MSSKSLVIEPAYDGMGFSIESFIEQNPEFSDLKQMHQEFVERVINCRRMDTFKLEGMINEFEEKVESKLGNKSLEKSYRKRFEQTFHNYTKPFVLEDNVYNSFVKEARLSCEEKQERVCPLIGFLNGGLVNITDIVEHKKAEEMGLITCRIEYPGAFGLDFMKSYSAITNMDKLAIYYRARHDFDKIGPIGSAHSHLDSDYHPSDADRKDKLIGITFSYVPHEGSIRAIGFISDKNYDVLYQGKKLG